MRHGKSSIDRALSQARYLAPLGYAGGKCCHPLLEERTILRGLVEPNRLPDRIRRTSRRAWRNGPQKISETCSSSARSLPTTICVETGTSGIIQKMTITRYETQAKRAFFMMRRKVRKCRIAPLRVSGQSVPEKGTITIHLDITERTRQGCTVALGAPCLVRGKINRLRRVLKIITKRLPLSVIIIIMSRTGSQMENKLHEKVSKKVEGPKEHTG